MLFFNSLKSARTLGDIAELLGFKASALAYILYKKDEALKYNTFDIPKKHGGVRKISAPSDDLKLIQRRLSDLLISYLNAISSSKILKNSISHGFEPGKSIITNAESHRNRRYVFNVDIKDFFGTINFGRIRGIFIKDEDFQLSESVATILAQIACHENALPQGSPCSPAISNLVGHVLDIHLVKLAARTGCYYTRYADDLTFSTNTKTFPKRIAEPIDSKQHIWIPGRELERLVKLGGFELNPKKTRMQYQDSRQEVTGLIVNRKVNVRSEYRHHVRAMVHRLFTTGQFYFDKKAVKENNEKQKIPGTLSQLHGMLGFIHEIDLYNHERNKKTPHHDNTYNKLPKSKETIYRRFLLFKNFYAAPTPVILCEGKTDNVYLVHAIRRLAAEFPKLATMDKSGKIELAVRLFKNSDTSTGKILGVTGGGPCIKNFINLYRAEIKRFSAPGMKNPVILLIDNDSGSDEIYSILKQFVRPAPSRSDPFIHVIANLYVVPTPLLAGDKHSMIEDFFDSELKTTVISGKSFHPGKNADEDVHYGKVVFAHKVVRAKADSIDFSGFRKILANLTSVIDEHARRFPSQ